MGATTVTEPNLNTNSSQTTTLGQDKTVRYRMSFIDDNTNIMIELKKLITGQNKSVNTAFDLGITFPTFSISPKVILTGGTVRMNANNITVINCIFEETD